MPSHQPLLDLVRRVLVVAQSSGDLLACRRERMGIVADGDSGTVVTVDTAVESRPNTDARLRWPFTKALFPLPNDPVMLLSSCRSRWRWTRCRWQWTRCRRRC